MRAPGHAAAAAREQGATALAAGALDQAERALAEAVELAASAGDEPGRGAAANALGLARLAAGRPDDAEEAFRDALAAHPRTLRPEDYAMVQANLALAHERTGRAPRARLAARQALAIRVAAEPVRAQAAAVLERLGGGPGDVLDVLDEEATERWPAIARAEVLRWCDLDPAERRTEAGAWIAGQLERPDRGPDLAEAWVGALLELPPAALEGVIVATVEALGGHDPDTQQRFRHQFSLAAARFHVPQLMRLTDAFNRIAADLGEQPAWR